MVYLTSGGSWLLAEQVVAAVCALILAVAFGHFASKDLYGNYKYVLSLASLLGAFSLSGINIAMTQSIARGHEGALKQGVRLNLRWSIGIPIIALAIGLYYLITGNPFVAISMCIVALFVPLINSFTLFDTFLLGTRKFSTSASYAMSTNVIIAGALIAVLLFGQRAIFVVLAYFVVNAALDVFFYWRSCRLIKNDEKDPELLRYSFHLSTMGVIGVIADKIDSIVIFTLLGPAQLAIYAYAIAIPEQIKGLLKNIATLSIPRFAQRPIKEIRTSIWHRIALLGCMITFGVILYIFLIPWIFPILFPVYITSIPYSQLYAVSIIFTAITYPLLSILQSHKKIKELYFANNVGPVIIIIVLPLFTYFWGIEGAIISQIIYRTTTFLTILWQFLTME